MDLLSPAQLDAIIAEMTAAGLIDADADNTIKAYRNGIEYLSAWHSLRYGSPLETPTPMPVVLQYIVEHTRPPETAAPGIVLPETIDEALVQAGLKRARGIPAFATMRIRLTALTALHRLKRLPSPCQDPVVTRYLKRLAQEHALRGDLRGPIRPAVTQNALEAMLATCDDSLLGLRDRALLSFAWSAGGRKPGEIAALQVQDLERTARQSYLFMRPGERHPTLGAITLDGPAATALEAWLARAAITEGPLFRRTRGSRKPRVTADGLSAEHINAIVKQRAVKAGLGDTVSTHSLRLGFVSHSVAQGSPLGEVVRKVDVSDLSRVIDAAIGAPALSVDVGNVGSPPLDPNTVSN